MEHYSEIKKWILITAIMWIKLENMLNEKTQPQKVEYFMTVWNRIGKSIQTEKREVIAKGCEEEGLKNNCLMGMELYIQVMEMFWNLIMCWFHSTVKILNATLLFPLKWLILCYMNFTSFKKKPHLIIIIRTKQW